MRRTFAYLFYLALLIPGLTASLKAQTGSLRVSIPSPTAASLGKFGEVPVNLYSGVPDITVPLFVVKGRTIDLPIQLKYHAGGIKVQEIGGWAGIGWALEAGGVITRTVRGLVDEKPAGYYYTGQNLFGPTWQTPSATLLSNLKTELVDGEPDQFFFNFNGRSGQFAIGPTSTTAGVVDYRTFPQQKLNITPVIVANAITEWTVTTEDGTRYRFAAVETSTDFNITGTMPVYQNHVGEAYNSSWHLTSIASATGDTIFFSYTPYTARHQLATYTDRNEEIVGGACAASSNAVTNEAQTVVQKLTTITSAAHTVTFASPTLRTDALSPTGVQQEPRLELITVATPSGTVIRKFQFGYDYSTGRLTLRNVSEQDALGVSLPPHTFDYSATQLPVISSLSQDHWGYFNGKANTTLLPPFSSAIAAYGGGDRTPAAGSVQAGMLTKITYPTGGYSLFTYELNSYGAVGTNVSSIYDDGPEQNQVANSSAGLVSNNFTVGGTQPVIATIYTNQSPSGCGQQVFPPCPYTELVVGTTTYRWDDNAVHFVTLPVGTYTVSANAQNQGTAGITVFWHNRIVTSSKNAGGVRIAEIRTGDGTGAANEQVRKYFYTMQAEPTRSSGSIPVEPLYEYPYSSGSCSWWSRSSQSKMPLGSGPVVGYREVLVQYGATGEFGKTRHAFRSYYDSNDIAPTLGVWPFSRKSDFEWQRGQETAATDLNAAGQTQRSTTSAYNFAATSATKEFHGISFNALAMGQYGTTYLYNPFVLTSNWAFLDNEVITTYDQNGANSFQTTKTYVYSNPVHGQLMQLTETNSDGTQRITRMRYPADYAAGAGNAEAVALTAMQGTTHNHSAVIERWVNQKVGATETTLQAQVTSFKLFGTNQYAPYQTFVLSSTAGVTNYVPASTAGGSFTKDTRYLLQETANSYDGNGRITQLTDPRGKITNYLYGGNTKNAFLTKVTRVKDAGLPTDLVTDLAYDANTGYLTSIKDEGGTFKFFTYDGYGRLRQVKNNGSTAVRAYGYTYSRTSGNGWVYQTGSPNAVVDTTFVQSGVVVEQTGYLDGLGRPIQALVKDGTTYHTTATQYDLMGRTWRVWKPYPKAGAAYDPSFSTNAVTHYNSYLGQSPSNPYVETQYTTDGLSRVSKVIPEYVGASATAFAQYFYGTDAATKQQFTEVTDELSKKTRNYATIFGAGVKTILGYGAAEATTTNFTANILGQRTQATDPRGLNTTYAWDTRGLLGSKTSPDAGTVQQKYDKAGNLRFSQDAKQAAAGVVYFTNFDFAGRPLRSGQGVATFGPLLDPDVAQAFEAVDANALVVRAYDAKPSTAAFPWTLFSTQITALTLTNVSGRLAAVASLSGGSWQASLFSYDTDGRVATRYTYTHANGGTTVLTALNTTATYTRDLRDALTQRSLTVGSATFNHWYDYDGRGLLWKVYASTTGVKPGSPDVTYTYRPSGQVDTRGFLGGPSVPLKYTIREQLALIGDTASTTYPFSAGYKYHANGTVSEAQFYNAGSPAAAKRYKYAFATTSYDALNRLKSADFSSWSGSAWTSTLAHDLAGITYDLAGNLTALQRYRETGTLIDNLTYTNSATTNRLNSVTDAVAATPETWDAETGTFTYDLNGNLATAPAPYGITAVTYDPQNLPTSLTANGTTTTYRYTDGGQRLSKQVGAGNAEYYLLEGATSLGVFTVTSGGTVASSFFNVLAGDKVIGRQPSVGNRRYYHGDLLGSTRSVVDGATVVEASDYDPWGLLMPGRTLGSGTKQGFTGKEQDAETGLDYFGARYYLPALARWGGVDPLGEKHPEWAPYNYVLNNPNALVDPDGRQVAALAAEYGAFVKLYGDDAANRMAQQNLDATLTALTVMASFAPVSRLAGGLALTGLDAARGKLSFWGTVANFAFAGKGKVVEQATEGGVRLARTAETLGADAAKSAFDVAKAGGKHAGFLENYAGRTSAEINRAIASIEKEIAKHESWIANPKSKIPGFESLDPRQQAALLNNKWPTDIARQREQIAILRGLLGER